MCCAVEVYLMALAGFGFIGLRMLTGWNGRDEAVDLKYFESKETEKTFDKSYYKNWGKMRRMVARDNKDKDIINKLEQELFGENNKKMVEEE